MLSDLTEAGVNAAVVEFDRLGRDRFLARYGFGRSRSYHLVIDGRRYDSKAICGAAHGYDQPDEGPLGPGDFSGGQATVARCLQQLGFHVEGPATQPSNAWTEEERLLALDLYLRIGTSSSTNPDVIALSEELNRHRLHPDAGTRDTFRNPNGVALKLANFAALDPSYSGAGMTRYSNGDQDTWEQYAGDRNLLDQAVHQIRDGQRLEPQPVYRARDLAPLSRPVEDHHTDAYEIIPTTEPVLALRREAQLVRRFTDWLRHSGATVTAHHYPIVTPPLRSDLADETNHRLWEAKSDLSRQSVRMALGQLLDYLRFEPSHWTGGVLLPNRPTDDLHDLIHTSNRSAAWPTDHDTFHQTDPGR